MAYMKDSTGKRLDSLEVVDSATANQSFAPISGNTFIAEGDSITEVNSTRANNSWGDSWATYACLASAGRLIHQYTCAKGGFTSAQINGIFQTEVWDAGIPHKLLIMADGTNDTTPTADTMPNNEALIKGSIKRGVKVALCTIPPAGMQAIGPPASLTLTALPGFTGGTLPAGTYYYQIVSRALSGGSAAGVEQSVTLSATGAIRLDWPPVGGATGYVIWGRTQGNAKAVVVINGPGTANAVQNQYVDLGAATSAGTMTLTDTSANNNLTSAARAKLTKVNAVKHHLASKYGLPLIDQYAILSDWVNGGQYKKNYTGDGTHPVPSVQKLMGVNVAATLKPWLTPRVPYLAADDSDPTSIMKTGNAIPTKTGALLTPNNPGEVVPAGWSWYGSGGGSTTLATDANVPGYVFTVNRTDWTGRFADVLLVRSTWAVGDLISVAFKVKSSGLDAIDGGGLAVGLKAVGSTGAGYITQLTISKDVPVTDLPGGWAIWTGRANVPPGTTDLQVFFYVTGNGVSASIAQLTIRNLTALGLVG